MSNTIILFTSILLLPLWVCAWIHWFFQGELRHFLFAYIFPSKWRNGYSRSQIIDVSREDFDLFLAAELSAPFFVSGVLGCPSCFSTYASAAGAALVGASIIAHPVFILPLLWAAAAYVGHRLYHFLSES